MKNSVIIFHRIRKRRSDYVRKRLYQRIGHHAANMQGKLDVHSNPSPEWLSKYAPAKLKKKETLVLRIPRNFSILDNPNETLIALHKFIFDLTCFKYVKNLFFDYSNVNNFDLAAETILDMFAHEFESCHCETKFAVTYPPSKSACRFLASMGIIKELNLQENDINIDADEKLNLFRKCSGNFSELTVGVSRNYIDVITQNFAKYLNDCVANIGYRLQQRSVSRICQYISEILYNINEHSDLNLWRISGYLDFHENDPTCEIAIVNFGTPIYDTFTEDIINSNYDMLNYLQTHKHFLPKNELITVYSLQGNVSSKNISKTLTRGQGTIEYLGFFIALSKELKQLSPTLPLPQMIILSGTTFIMLDDKIQKIKDSFGRWIIPLNTNNSLSYPPDKKYVTHLKNGFFPGTVISIKFHLPNNMIQEQ